MTSPMNSSGGKTSTCMLGSRRGGVQREARDNVLGILLNDAGEILPSYYGYRTHGYGYTPEEAGGA